MENLPVKNRKLLFHSWVINPQKVQFREVALWLPQRLIFFSFLSLTRIRLLWLKRFQNFINYGAISIAHLFHACWKDAIKLQHLCWRGAIKLLHSLAIYIYKGGGTSEASLEFRVLQKGKNSWFCLEEGENFLSFTWKKLVPPPLSI